MNYSPLRDIFVLLWQEILAAILIIKYFTTKDAKSMQQRLYGLCSESFIYRHDTNPAFT